MSTHTRHFRVSEVRPYINWPYFFHAWGFPVRFSAISQIHACPSCRKAWTNGFPSEERTRAIEAMKLYDDACRVLDSWGHSPLCTHSRVRLLEANGDGEDIVLTRLGITIPLLRQQHPAEEGPCLCLADFVRPLESGKADRIGLFVCTADQGFVTGNLDDYQSLLCQTLADRLAEATAELAHQITRREWWGYAPDENLCVRELFEERYQGKRPAVGYPSLPDQSLCFLLSDLLDFPSLGVTLTESGAMVPHASTCGLMLSHPATRHFSVGPVSDDQLQDYARRRGMKVEDLRRFVTH